MGRSPQALAQVLIQVLSKYFEEEEAWRVSQGRKIIVKSGEKEQKDRLKETDYLLNGSH